MANNQNVSASASEHSDDQQCCPAHSHGRTHKTQQAAQGRHAAWQPVVRLPACRLPFWRSPAPPRGPEFGANLRALLVWSTLARASCAAGRAALSKKQLAADSLFTFMLYAPRSAPRPRSARTGSATSVARVGRATTAGGAAATRAAAYSRRQTAPVPAGSRSPPTSTRAASASTTPASWCVTRAGPGQQQAVGGASGRWGGGGATLPPTRKKCSPANTLVASPRAEPDPLVVHPQVSGECPCCAGVCGCTPGGPVRCATSARTTSAVKVYPSALSAVCCPASAQRR